MGKNESLPVFEHHAPPPTPWWRRRVIWLLAVSAVLLTLHKLQFVSHVKARCHNDNGLQLLPGTRQEINALPNCQSPECIYAAMAVQCNELDPHSDQCITALRTRFEPPCMNQTESYVFAPCLDEGRRSMVFDRTILSLLGIIKSYLPLSHPQHANRNLGNLVSVLRNDGIIALASITPLEFDPSNVSQSTTTFSAPPTIGMPTKEDYADEKVMDYYEGTIGRIFQRLQLTSQPVPRKVIHFEQKLAGASTSPDEMFDVTKYQLATWDGSAKPELPFLEQMFLWPGYGRTPVKHVVNMAPHYLNELKTILEGTEPEVIRAYLYWKVIQTYGPFIQEDDDETYKPLQNWNNYIAERSMAGKNHH